MNDKRLVLGILAHVDAGKTTLAESFLYKTGSIRKLGRVDHQDAFLDNFDLERSRGITIFSKQAELLLEEVPVTLMDTPGHVDFSAEMERTLQILDYAVLVISGADGVQGHVETLWRLLKRYEIPVFLFINKMDQPGTDKSALMDELTRKLDSRCVDFTSIAEIDSGIEKNKIFGEASTNPMPPEVQEMLTGSEEQAEELKENIAVCDEELLEKYLEDGEVTGEEISTLIHQRKLFPCYFGSALKLWGVDELLEGIRHYGQSPAYPEQFGARVFKITRDAQGNRLTHMKIMGGSLKVKTLLSGQIKPGLSDASRQETDPEQRWEQKVDQIRIYSGGSYQPVPQAEAGSVCAVTGLDHTYTGEGLGCCTAADQPLLEPVLSYRIEIPAECDVHRTFLQLRQLEEEEPELHIVWDEQMGEIHAQLMGEVQTEVLKNIIKERFGILVSFGAGSIVYKETIANAVEGMGHFEPLRHYAEVHLLMEPGERGSGLQFAADCSEDILDRNWQRLILTHLEEKQHRGVLTGSEITDMKITLVTGRAHLKHTEGGDFRQATYRAVRHGLKWAKSILLEPVYEFRMELPADSLGRAMSDVQKMHGSFEPAMIEGDLAVLTGQAPVITMRGYQTELIAYTKGKGRLFCTLKGYEPCHNAEEVIEERGYDSELDFDNPTGSVFCSHGAGYVVPWEQVHEFIHMDSGLGLGPIGPFEYTPEPEPVRFNGSFATGPVDENELKAIFERTYGKASEDEKERRKYAKSRRIEAPTGLSRPRNKEKTEEYLLVDGYNIIFAWEDLNELAKVNIDAARDKLMDEMSNYQGYKKCHLILVFDAYKVAGGKGSVFKFHNIHVVYTKEAETADQYIEKTVRTIGHRYHVTVATSDALEQMIIMGAGAARMSAKDLREDVKRMTKELRSSYLEQAPAGAKNYLFDGLDENASKVLQKIRSQDES